MMQGLLQFRLSLMYKILSILYAKMNSVHINQHG